MRLRGRIAYKLLILIAATVVLLIICLNYYTSNDRKDDDFLTHLPSLSDDDPLSEDAASAMKATRHLSYNSDVNLLLNLTNFAYRMPNDICRKYEKGLLAILIVTSYAGHDELRAAHRQAISQSKLSEMGFQRIFLLAEPPPNDKFITQAQLQDEQLRFNDLLQGNFQEAYRNLSYKHVMGLRWATSECKRAKFIIKLDDDIIYDVFQLRRYLESLEVQQPKLAASSTFLAGFILEAKPPIRNVANKWYVSEREYPLPNYPAYLSGWLYITNPATAFRLVLEAQHTSYFWIDDTWVTGVLRVRQNISMQRLNSWYSANAEFLDCCVRDLKQFNFECEYFVGPNGGDAKLLVEFLHNVEKCYFDECSKRAPEKSLKQTCVASAKHIVPDHGSAQIKQIKLR